MKESGIGRENGLEAYEACRSCTGITQALTHDVYRFTDEVHHREHSYRR